MRLRRSRLRPSSSVVDAYSAARLSASPEGVAPRRQSAAAPETPDTRSSLLASCLPARDSIGSGGQEVVERGRPTTWAKAASSIAWSSAVRRPSCCRWCSSQRGDLELLDEQAVVLTDPVELPADCAATAAGIAASPASPRGRRVAGPRPPRTRRTPRPVRLRFRAPTASAACPSTPAETGRVADCRGCATPATIASDAQQHGGREQGCSQAERTRHQSPDRCGHGLGAEEHHQQDREAPGPAPSRARTAAARP